MSIPSAGAAGASAACLVAYHFPPVNMVAAQRALRIARALLERYDAVYVIRRSPSQLRPDLLDHEYGKDVLTHPRVRLVDTEPWLANRGESARTRLLHRLGGGALGRMFCGPGVEWIPALSAALKGLPNLPVVRVLIATGPPFPPFLASVQWASAHGIPVILDYRDLWTGNPIARYPGLSRFAVDWLLERPLNRKASLLMTVSEGCKKALSEGGAGSKVRLLRNLPDACYREEFRAIASAVRRRGTDAAFSLLNPLRLVFTGQVYPTCTFAPVIRAALSLSPSASGCVRFHYFGACSPMVCREFEQLGASHLLNDHGMVPKAKAIEAVASADVLLSLVHGQDTASHPSVSGLMTTKVYDYFLSGRPILNIGPADAEVNRFAREIGYAPFYSYAARDYEGIRTFLERAVGDKEYLQGRDRMVDMPDFSEAFGNILDEVVADGAEKNRNTERRSGTP